MPDTWPRSVAIWVGVNSKHSFPYLRYIRPVSQYCAFSLIILCPWWEYISTEEQLIYKSADGARAYVRYVSKTQDHPQWDPSQMDTHLYKTILWTGPISITVGSTSSRQELVSVFRLLRAPNIITLSVQVAAIYKILSRVPLNITHSRTAIFVVDISLGSVSGA